MLSRKVNSFRLALIRELKNHGPLKFLDNIKVDIRDHVVEVEVAFDKSRHICYDLMTMGYEIEHLLQWAAQVHELDEEIKEAKHSRAHLTLTVVGQEIKLGFYFFHKESKRVGDKDYKGL